MAKNQNWKIFKKCYFTLQDGERCTCLQTCSEDRSKWPNSASWQRISTMDM